MGLRFVKSMDSSTTNTPSKFPFEDTPDEVLTHILSFVPGPDLVKSCRVVSRKWKNLVDSPTLWRLKILREGVLAPLSLLGAHEAGEANIIDLSKIYVKKPFRRNLLVNWDGKDGMSGWNIVANGGNRWKIEDAHAPGYAQPLDADNVPDGCKCWVSSYGWCYKEQVVDLVKQGLDPQFIDTYRPPIHISEWTCARQDCGSVFNIGVSLLKSKQETRAQKSNLQNSYRDTMGDDRVHPDYFMKNRYIPQWQDGCWEQITHTFTDYPPGVRYVFFQHGGKDTQFWAGHFGAKMAMPSVTVDLPNV